MHHPAGRQVVVGGDRRPGGESASDRAAAPFRKAEHAGGVEAVAEQLGDAARAALVGNRADRQDAVVEAEARLVADIERWMGVEDLQPGEQQEEERERPDEMGEARPRRLAVDQRFLGLQCRGHGFPSRAATLGAPALQLKSNHGETGAAVSARRSRSGERRVMVGVRRAAWRRCSWRRGEGASWPRPDPCRSETCHKPPVRLYRTVSLGRPASRRSRRHRVRQSP